MDCSDKVVGDSGVLGAAGLWVGERNTGIEFGLGAWTAMTRKLLIHGLDAADLWVGDRNTNTKFGLGPWIAVGRNMLSKTNFLAFYCLNQAS